VDGPSVGTYDGTPDNSCCLGTRKQGQKISRYQHDFNKFDLLDVKSGSVGTSVSSSQALAYRRKDGKYSIIRMVLKNC
jgi:hypothetical protein